MLRYLIYASRPFGFDTAALNGILLSARRNNVRNGITGALIVRHDLYLQWLEGPGDALDRLFDLIRDDDRHLDVELLDDGASEVRSFGDWAMRDDPAESWMWSEREVAAGAVRAARSGDIRAVFARLAASVPDPVRAL